MIKQDGRSFKAFADNTANTNICRLSAARQVSIKKIYQKTADIIMANQSDADNWIITFTAECLFNNEQRSDDLMVLTNEKDNRMVYIYADYLEMNDDCYYLTNTDLTIIHEIKQILSPTGKQIE